MAFEDGKIRDIFSCPNHSHYVQRKKVSNRVVIEATVLCLQSLTYLTCLLILYYLSLLLVFIMPSTRSQSQNQSTINFPKRKSSRTPHKPVEKEADPPTLPLSSQEQVLPLSPRKRLGEVSSFQNTL